MTHLRFFSRMRKSSFTPTRRTFSNNQTKQESASIFNIMSPATALLTGIMAGSVAIFATAAIDLAGPSVGGILATAPTTIVAASFGFAHTLCDSDRSHFRDALFSVPTGMLINAAFLLTWRFAERESRLLKKSVPTIYARCALCIAASFVVWLVLSITVAHVTSTSLSERIRIGYNNNNSSSASSAVMISPTAFGSASFFALVCVGVAASWNVGKHTATVKRATTTPTSTTLHPTQRASEVEMAQTSSAKCSCCSVAAEVDCVETGAAVSQTNGDASDSGQQQQQQPAATTSSPAESTIAESAIFSKILAKFRLSILSRGLFSGITNCAAILIADSGQHSVLGGLTSTFPAIFTTIVVVSFINNKNNADDADDSAGTDSAIEPASKAESPIGPILLGSAAVPTYSVSFFFLASAFDCQRSYLILVSLCCWLLAVLGWSLPATNFLTWRRAAHPG